jgi:hypothetical protein
VRVAAAVLVAYAWLFPWLPGLRSPNELSRLYQARAIADEHTLAVNGQLARYGPVGDLSVYRGRYFPNKAPGVSFLGAAALAAFHPEDEAAQVLWLRLVACILPAATATALLRELLARRFEARLATAGALTFALGTIFWPYSTFLVSHGVSASAVIACWWSVERRRWLLAGLLAGSAVLFEYTSALAIVALAVQASLLRWPEETVRWPEETVRWPEETARWPEETVRPERSAAERRGVEGRAHRLGLFIAGLAPPLLLLAAYHQVAFGHPLHTGYRHLVNPAFAGWHARGFMGVGAPSLPALAGSFLDPYKGLFLWCPFLALGVPGFAPLARKDRALARLCLAELLLYALFTASFTYQAWGWTVGPRHVTPLCAFLVPPALAAAEWLRERGAGFVAGGLALAGVALVATTVAVCPYLPEELTNPFWQLVVPLARAGLRSRDVLGLALRVDAWWTLVPWIAVVIASAGFAASTLSGSHASRAAQLALTLAVAVAFLAGHAQLGQPDAFERTRTFMRDQFRGPPSGTWWPRLPPLRRER